MPLLTTIEDALVTRLATAVYGSGPLFATVRGLSGPYRPVLRQSLERDRFPAAFVIFLDEKVAPETDPLAKGPRYSILLADRALRITSDPRRGDADTLGAYTLIERTRLRLDLYAPVSGSRMTPLLQRFVDADDRLGLYEILYALRPIEAPLFDGDPLAGEGRFTMIVDPPQMSDLTFAFPGIDGAFRQVLAERPRPIHWHGELRAADAAGLNALEAALDAHVRGGLPRTITDAASRSYPDCVLVSWRRDGPRRIDTEPTAFVQPCSLAFLQLSP